MNDIKIQQENFGEIIVQPVSHDGEIITFWNCGIATHFELKPALEFCWAIRKQIIDRAQQDKIPTGRIDDVDIDFLKRQAKIILEKKTHHAYQLEGKGFVDAIDFDDAIDAMYELITIMFKSN
jgi:hypothetical protein